MNLSKELQLGKAGEHLVCFDLISQGFSAFLSDQGLPYDVLLDLSGVVKRIQVKTCSQKSNYGKSKNVYRFSLRSAKGANRAIKANSIDYVAFVFLDIKKVQYISIEKITTNTGFLKQCIDFRLEKTNGGQKYVIGNYPFPTEKI
jgi:hypothetical protein